MVYMLQWESVGHVIGVWEKNIKSKNEISVCQMLRMYQKPQPIATLKNSNRWGQPRSQSYYTNSNSMQQK